MRHPAGIDFQQNRRAERVGHAVPQGGAMS